MSVSNYQSPATAAPLNAVDEARLDSAFKSLRGALASATAAPASLEPALMAAFRKHHAGGASVQGVAQWFAPGMALVACIGMSAWLLLLPLAPIGMQGLPPASGNADRDTPFVALQSLEQIALEPTPRVVGTTVPRMWLASYGVPVNPENAGDSVRAEMLVSANGQPLAMRFLP